MIHTATLLEVLPGQVADAVHWWPRELRGNRLT